VASATRAEIAGTLRFCRDGATIFAFVEGLLLFTLFVFPTFHLLSLPPSGEDGAIRLSLAETNQFRIKEAIAGGGQVASAQEAALHLEI
jgi:hypothetical protein